MSRSKKPRGISARTFGAGSFHDLPKAVPPTRAQDLPTEPRLDSVRGEWYTIYNPFLRGCQDVWGAEAADRVLVSLWAQCAARDAPGPDNFDSNWF